MLYQIIFKNIFSFRHLLFFKNGKTIPHIISTGEPQVKNCNQAIKNIMGIIFLQKKYASLFLQKYFLRNEDILHDIFTVYFLCVLCDDDIGSQ